MRRWLFGLLACVIASVAVWQSASTVWPGTRGSTGCGDKNARLVAQAGTLSDPAFEARAELRRLIESNRRDFAQDGGAIRCMEAIAAFLIGAATEGYQLEAGTTSAAEKWGGRMPAGISHIPGEVDDSMGTHISPMAGSYLAGQNFAWLARVLPAAAAGDWSAYERHEVFGRQWLYENLNTQRAFCQMFGAQCCQLYPLVCPEASSTRQAMRRKNEQQLYELARALN